jgi:hypothetical protein
MSLSRIAVKVGLSLGALCAAAVLTGIAGGGAVASADGDGDGPPPPATTAPATTEGHPWHG